jgi:hypothetical protein
MTEDALKRQAWLLGSAKGQALLGKLLKCGFLAFFQYGRWRTDKSMPA